ncbi:MAG TPA: hydrogenase maturation nickel metallochaperone HypA [Anaerolineaceae bacterium]
MHELAVTESILSIAEKHALQAGASKVTDIYITLGQLSSIVDDSVHFYWDIISQEAALSRGAVLHFQRIPARLLCLECANEYGIQTALEPCPRCGSFQIKVTAGEEFWVDSIEIEKTDEEKVA